MRHTARQTQPAGARRARGPQVFPARATAWATGRAVTTGHRGAPPTPQHGPRAAGSHTGARPHPRQATR
eukprot:13374142-Alexandrium_andersonii.AAC.1